CQWGPVAAWGDLITHSGSGKRAGTDGPQVKGVRLPAADRTHCSSVLHWPSVCVCVCGGCVRVWPPPACTAHCASVLYCASVCVCVCVGCVCVCVCVCGCESC